MGSFAVNYSPLMTSSLVRDGVFRDDPVVLLDIGARGGVGREWEVFGDQLRAYAFEPDEAECQRLAATAPPNLTYIPRALGRAHGRYPLYQTAHADSASLYRPNERHFSRFLNGGNAELVGETTVEVCLLDEVLKEFSVPAVDFMKLDVEGAELDVLAGGAATVEATSLLGLVSEIRFHSEINGSPAFGDFDGFLRKCGFSLFDLEFHHHSRRSLPYPGLQHYRRANGDPFFAYTIRGQIQDGNALYLRDFLTAEAAIGKISATSLLKLSAIMEIFGLNDCAAELLLANRKRIDEVSDSSRLLDLLASGIMGRPTTLAAYTERFFRHPTLVAADLEPSPEEPSLLKQLLRAASLHRKPNG